MTKESFFTKHSLFLLPKYKEILNTINFMPLNISVNKRIRKDKRLRGKLAEYFDLCDASVQRMLYENDERFTQIECLEIIKRHFNYIDINDLVTNTLTESLNVERGI